MESNWAAEHLQTIRTLMERSAIYRRALAPIMIYIGLLACVSSAIAIASHLESPKRFVGYWIGVSGAAIVGSFLMIRRQALKDAEPFWTPPTRRVAEALLPALFFGAVVTVVISYFELPSSVPLLPLVWMPLYGCALHGAGFFMPRGIKWLGWLFILFGSALLIFSFLGAWPEWLSPNLLMGASFGGLHLAYGIYLFFTEKRRNET
jgi:hypothetical protein